jgi:hypothetical protein
MTVILDMATLQEIADNHEERIKCIEHPLPRVVHDEAVEPMPGEMFLIYVTETVKGIQ